MFCNPVEIFHINISIKNNMNGVRNCSAFCVKKSSRNFKAIMLIFCRMRSLTTMFELFSKIVAKRAKTFVITIVFDNSNLVVLYLQIYLVCFRRIFMRVSQ